LKKVKIRILVAVKNSAVGVNGAHMDGLMTLVIIYHFVREVNANKITDLTWSYVAMRTLVLRLYLEKVL
tara:strand:+ start:65 stop:271 length:207 start_codon:yes stop_codon:yes gene_type:complete